MTPPRNGDGMLVDPMPMPQIAYAPNVPDITQYIGNDRLGATSDAANSALSQFAQAPGLGVDSRDVEIQRLQRELQTYDMRAHEFVQEERASYRRDAETALRSQTLSFENVAVEHETLARDTLNRELASAKAHYDANVSTITKQASEVTLC